MHDNMVDSATRQWARSAATAASRGIRVLETAAMVLTAVHTAAKMVEYMKSVSTVHQQQPCLSPPVPQLSIESDVPRALCPPPPPPSYTSAPKKTGWTRLDPGPVGPLSVDGRLF